MAIFPRSTRLGLKTYVGRLGEPTALAAGLATPTLGSPSPEASACGSLFETKPSRGEGEGRRRATRRRGLTLAELLIVSAVMVLLAGTLATLAAAVQVSNEYHHGRGLMLQHGRVATGRIQRACDEATANEQFPGFVVFTETLGGWKYPDTLVVWKPLTSAADPAGLPRVHELVVFSPASGTPNRLYEYRLTTNTSVVPALTDTGAWQYLLSQIKSSSGTSGVMLTDLLRVATATNPAGHSLGQRGCVRFEVMYRPSQTQWAEYKAGTRAWNNLAWAQSIHSARTGLRQAWCGIELQLRPADTDDNSASTAIPFFGSAAVYSDLPR